MRQITLVKSTDSLRTIAEVFAHTFQTKYRVIRSNGDVEVWKCEGHQGDVAKAEELMEQVEQ